MAQGPKFLNGRVAMSGEFTEKRTEIPLRKANCTMSTEGEQRDSFFQTVYEEDENFDSLRFLIEVEAQFKSEDVLSQVRMRLEVLNEITSKPGLEDLSDALRHRLTQIFTGGSEENEVLQQLKELTQISTPTGEKLDLRSFFKRDRRVLSEQEYRSLLEKKISNTHTHVINLIAYYPEAERDLNRLSRIIQGLSDRISTPEVDTGEIKQLEDELRETTAFDLYEELKERFLKDWLARFTGMNSGEIEGLTPGDIQELIQEHQRHQMTQLLKGKVKLVETDMSTHLGLHDTLEGNFRDQEFWKGANVAVKTAFIKWIMDVVQAHGMLRGLRYAFFQSEENREQYLLFGLGISELPDTTSDDPIRMIPYIKPFTRKGTYLLEIRKRNIGDAESYFHELLHYTMPFLFAFDQMREFEIRKELTSFFTSKY